MRFAGRAGGAPAGRDVRGGAFAFAVSALDEPRPSATMIALLVAAAAIAWRLEFETATGVTGVPNVLALWLMFVLLPPGLAAPVAAVAGGLLGDAFAAERWRRLRRRPVVARSFVLLATPPRRYSIRAAAGAMPRVRAGRRALGGR